MSKIAQNSPFPVAASGYMIIPIVMIVAQITLYYLELRIQSTFP